MTGSGYEQGIQFAMAADSDRIAGRSLTSDHCW